MSGSFEITLGLAELRGAYWLYLRRRWLWRRMVLAYLAMTAIYAALLIGRDAADWGFDPTWALHRLGQAILYAAVGVALMVALALWRVPRGVRRLYEQAGLEGRTTRFDFDAVGLRTANTEATTDIPWTRFVAWAENEHYLLLYRTDAAFITVPKAQVAAETISALRSAIAAAGVSKR
jgi:hypothetical protein